MNRKLPGFLTLSGALAALATLLVVLGVGLVGGGMLFSPGALSAKSGAALGGVSSHAGLATRCAACHTAFWDSATMTERCLACHTDVAAQLGDPKTLHGLFQSSNPGLACRACHTDHHGANASLTSAINASFPHEKLGYALTAHQKKTDGSPFTCADCHGTTYTGKYDQSVCITCHTQVKPDFMLGHLAAYAENCVACHDGIDSYGHAFDHSTVAFALTGKHIGLDCGLCHTGARTIADLKATAQDCGTCHAKNDAHNGQFGTSCGACHTTAGWLPATFDHNLSSFKLTGKHVSVACTGCHVNNVFKGTPTECYACHAKDDKHKGTFGTACQTCHTTAGWLPATFDHSKFPLTGAHAGLACTRCHTKNVFTGLSTACAACHADPAYHAGLFGTNCAQCHNTSNWSASYNGPHPNCGEGNCFGHGGASCRDCHTVNLMTASCTKCHDSNNPGDGGGGGGNRILLDIIYP
jgi:hypothetical protein